MNYAHALIIGASGGIGSALVDAVPAQKISTLSRSKDGLDLRDERSIAQAADRLDGPFDLVVDATGFLGSGDFAPEKSVRAINQEAMKLQFEINAIGPALLLKHFIPKLVRDERSVIATLSARVGSIGDNRLGGWVSYRASKAALNQIVKTTSIELSRTHKNAICIALHPGTVSTKLSESYTKNKDTFNPEDAARNLVSVIDNLSLEDTGKFLDWRGDEVEW